ncbi:hypothetical protein [Pseudoalteromonas sp. MMG005]|uniref:hypothetical protein n=1 Tax=Pseudoalteromonas sp. MMG005 TaxID=2822682 RepID=UPI001B3A1FDB|nr:hypothetical protein [Pseudoalteromonas sp. MMG005]MBQ4845633.1 hypothetical protein [Pseudoalteromonas sp. MMG005]
MKKAVLALIGATLFSGAALASSVSCYVDTRAYDEYRQGICFGGESLTHTRQGAAVFKVNTSKPVQSVEWDISRYNANCSGTTCIVRVGLGEHEVNACVDKIYYKDFTWADVNWCATAHANYWGQGGPLANELLGQ